MDPAHGKAPAQAPLFFYGWKIVAVVFVTQMLALGSTIYAFGLFVKPLTDEFQLSRADANTGLMLLLLGTAICSPLVGRLLDRQPVRLVMLCGAILLCTGFIAIAHAPSPRWMGLAVFLLVAPGVATIGPLTASTLVARWFHQHRGKAMGIAAVATSVGGLAMVPLIGLWIARFDWRQALVIQGLVILVVTVPLILGFIRNRPQDLGLQEDGRRERSIAAANPANLRRWQPLELLKQRNFWMIALAVGLIFAMGQSMLASLIPYATDLGISLPSASLLISYMASFGILGKLLFGAVADRVDKRYLFFFANTFSILFFLLLISKPGYGTLVAACCLLGLTTGGLLPIWSALLADCYGSASFGTVMGLMAPLHMPLSLLAIRFIGEVPDHTGNYDLAFMVFIALTLLSTIFVWLIRIPGRHGSAE